MARKIRIPEAAFKPIKITPGEAILTTFGFYGRFDQLVADCMQLKKAIYQEDGTALQEGLNEWKSDLIMYGADIVINPVQANLFSENKPLRIVTLRCDSFVIIKMKQDNKLRISFNAEVAGVPYAEIKMIERLKDGAFDLTVEPANKKEQEEAQQQAINFGLFKGPKADEPTEEPAAEATEADPDAPQPGEPEDLKGAALASWREVNGAKKRVPTRDKTVQ